MMKKYQYLCSALLLLAGCGSASVPASVRLTLPGFVTKGGEVFEPALIDEGQKVPGPSIDKFVVNIARPDGESHSIDLLEAVRNCSDSCEVPIVVEAGEGLVFDFQAYTGKGDARVLLRRGFAVTDVEEGTELAIAVSMWPAVRYAYEATTADSPISIQTLDVIRGAQGLILVAAFDKKPFDASNDRASRSVGGKIEFDFSAMGASELGGVPLREGFVVTHRLQLSPSCDRFLFAPSEISYAKVSSCGGLTIPGAGNPATLPYQIFGKSLFVNLPYNVIGGTSFVLSDLKKGTFVAGFQLANAADRSWQVIEGAIRP